MKKDFSAAYTYDAIGRPLTIRRYGVTGIDGTTESFGLLDGLTYSYDGALPSSIARESEALPFFGQIGATGTTLGYNKAGLLHTDTGRGIERTVYNLLGLPSEIEISPGRFAIKNFEKRLYSMSGSLISVSEFIDGYPAPVLTGKRTYIDRFTFACGSDGVDTLMRVDFPGGYFDSAGVHWMLPDAIGSVELVIDGKGNVEQHTGYYPYGEPWREPAGQPYLFGSKERRRFSGLGDYDFHARFLTTATVLWQAPDLHAGNRPWLSPFVFCSANPIRRIDPTGMDDFQYDWAKKHGVTVPFYPTNEDYAREYAREQFEQAKLEIEARSIRSSISIPRPVNEEKFTPEEKEAIASNAIATGTSLPEVITKEAGKRITKHSGDRAIIALGGREYYKLIKALRIFGPVGCYFSLKSTFKTWDDYHEAGGNDWRVNLKLSADVILAFAGLYTDLKVFGAVIIYSIADYAYDGFGTDSIIENQINQYNEQQYNN